MTVMYLLMSGGGSSSDPGGSGVVITLPPTISIVQSGSPSVSGNLSITNLGSIQATGVADTFWMVPYHSSLVADYEVMLTLTSGTPPNTGQALGLWYNLAGTSSWGWSVASPAPGKSFTGTLAIRRTAVPTDTDSCAVSVSLTQG